ncbi:hypothetical protein TNCV_3516801 [Trichonephila clavipes]|nr:hypothetical protein TNCV_3516801 [Trichonephila clavipes]
MATGSFMSHNYSSSQSEVPRDYHNGAQRINPENRVGSSFRIIPEQYFSGIENIDDFLRILIIISRIMRDTCTTGMCLLERSSQRTGTRLVQSSRL